jgi:hypothetical protein
MTSNNYEPQGELEDPKKEGYYTKHNITSADTTGKYSTEDPGDIHNQELVALYNYYHNIDKEHYKYLYYDEFPLTAKDIRRIYKDIIPKNVK